MKKFTFLLALLPALFTSCFEGDKIIEEVGPNTFSQPYQVYWDTNKPYFWKEAFDDSGRYYYCSIEEPRLTKYIMNNGLTNAYLEYGPAGTDYLVLAPLPFSDFIIDPNNGYKWEEHLTVEFTTGLITFILKIDDHDPIEPFYPDYKFVVKFMW
ncbi:hypothetical protein FACS189413_03760 [Bacteroidia bacterium]|nr:hypothetical protein FACS189463_1970 [Bacteroidia bacterium]GHU67959.1 hypothetical protein FACS189413_03760 [Bacteroidia bacterium]